MYVYVCMYIHNYMHSYKVQYCTAGYNIVSKTVFVNGLYSFQRFVKCRICLATRRLIDNLPAHYFQLEKHC